MDSILVNDKINDYFNKLIKKSSSIKQLKQSRSSIINNSFYDTYIKPNIIIIFLIIGFIVYFIIYLYFGITKKKSNKLKKKKFIDNFSTFETNYINDEHNTVFSEEDRQNLIKIIDELTIENYKQTLNNNEIIEPKVIKEINSNINSDFLNINNNKKYNTVINGILVESPFT